MAWLRIVLTEDEQRIVWSKRESHPNACARRRLWAIWLLHSGLKREQAAKILGLPLRPCNGMSRRTAPGA